MGRDNVENTPKGKAVSRRWLLRNTASLTAGVVAVGAARSSAADVTAAAETTAEAAIAPDHDPMTGEIFDRERHHHWDTV
jgi:hypothetical protein